MSVSWISFWSSRIVDYYSFMLKNHSFTSSLNHEPNKLVGILWEFKASLSFVKILVHLKFENLWSNVILRFLLLWCKILPKRFMRDYPAPADSNAWLDCNTTYTDDFVKHCFGPRESMCPVPKVEITGRMQSDTTYSVDYWDKSKNMQPRKKMAPQTHHVSGKCGDTTYNVDFADRGKGSPVVVVKHGCSLGSSGAKFNGDLPWWFQEVEHTQKVCSYLKRFWKLWTFCWCNHLPDWLQGSTHCPKMPCFGSCQTYIYLWRSYVLLDVKNMFICRHSSFNTSDNNVVTLFIKWVA